MVNTTADAVDREAAWLATSGDGLPGLLKGAGGPFDVVQAYWPRTQRSQQRGVYVLRRDILDDRFAAIQRLPQHQFVVRVVWPILASTGAAEEEQRALDAAVELLLKRIRGPMLDKSHGGRFLSVAENPAAIRVVFGDPEQTIPLKALDAQVSYTADDLTIND